MFPSLEELKEAAARRRLKGYVPPPTELEWPKKKILVRVEDPSGLIGKIAPTMLDRCCPSCGCFITSHHATDQTWLAVSERPRRCFGIKADKKRKGPAQTNRCGCGAWFPDILNWYGRANPYGLHEALRTYERGHPEHFGFILRIFAPGILDSGSFYPPASSVGHQTNNAQFQEEPYPSIPFDLTYRNPRYMPEGSLLRKEGARNLLEDFGKHTTVCLGEPCVCGFKELLSPGDYSRYRKGYSGLPLPRTEAPREYRKPEPSLKDEEVVCWSCGKPWTGINERIYGDDPVTCYYDHKPPKWETVSNCCGRRVGGIATGYRSGAGPFIGLPR